jgi:putative NADH-flavin reductase
VKILVLGATSGIGRRVVAKTLSAEGDCVELGGNADAAWAGKENLVAFRGDIMNAGALKTAMMGVGAIICSLGLSLAYSSQPTTYYSEATQNILRAMKAVNVRRLICVTGIGAGDSQGHGGFWHDYILRPLFLSEAYRDKTRQEEIIRKSELDWTIVRPAQLTDGPETGVYRVILGGGYRATKISRADVAHFIVEQIASPKYLQRAVVLCY